MNPQQIYVIYNKDDKESPFKSCFAEDFQEIETTINLNETENITVSTIENHKVYFETNGKRRKEPINIKNHMDEVAKVVENLQQLEEKSDRLIEESGGKHSEYAQLLKLQTTQLALLTEQKAVLDGAQSHLVRLWHLSWMETSDLYILYAI